MSSDSPMDGWSGMGDGPDTDGGRTSYLVGVVSLAASRVKYRIVAGEARQTLLSVLGIGLAVALMLVVTSVGLGLAAQGTVQAESTDFWIVPESGASSPVTQVGGTQLGRTHSVADRLTKRDDVSYATPVLVEVVRFKSADGATEQLFLVGIIPDTEVRTILGLRTSALDAGDPFYNEGAYNGTWTGQAVVSESAAQALDLSTGSHLSPASDRSENRSFAVVDVRRARAPGVGQLPVVMVHLAESQAVTGATSGDQADRILVDATDPAVRPHLEEVYPASKVMTQQGLLSQRLRSSDLPLAMSVAAVIVAVVVGLLTIVTTVGFEFVNDSGTRAVLASFGISGRTRVLMLAFETLLTAFVGGVLGVVGWLTSVLFINVVGREIVAVPVAVIRPEMSLYGLGVAIGIGLLSLPYLLILSRNRTVMEALPSQ